MATTMINPPVRRHMYWGISAVVIVAVILLFSMKSRMADSASTVDRSAVTGAATADMSSHVDSSTSSVKPSTAVGSDRE